MNKRSLAAFDGAACPCCAERATFTGPSAFKFAIKTGLCDQCVEVDEGKYDVPAFQWPTAPEEIEASAAKVLADAEANLAAVAAADPPTFATVIYPLMCPPNYKTNPLNCQSKFLQHCSTDPKVRAAAEEAGKKFAAFKAASRRNQAVFDKVRAFAATAEAKALGTHEAHFVEALLADFKRGGLALDAEGRVELQRLMDADAAACSKYGSNLGADATKLVFDASELEGLSDAFLAERRGADGKITISLKYPDLIPVLGECAVEATRKRLLQARETAYADNLELMAEGVGLRKQTATLLGYKSWSHFVIESRMAGTPETVIEFLGKVRSLASDGAAADLEALRLAKQAHLESRGEATSSDRVTLEAWDGSFYTNQILKRDYGVDHEAVRQYFPLDHVVRTTMDIYMELLGLKFTELPAGSFSRWHEEVRCFLVTEAGGGGGGSMKQERIGHFYLDLHPREGKYGHAAIFHLLKRNGEQTPVDCMMCNLPAPSKDGTPALLRHSDVVTFFHE